jgi:hypothetical protein
MENVIWYYVHGYQRQTVDKLREDSRPLTCENFFTNFFRSSGKHSLKSSEGFITEDLKTYQLIYRPWKTVVILLLSGAAFVFMGVQYNRYLTSTVTTKAVYQKNQEGNQFAGLELVSNVASTGKSTCRTGEMCSFNLKVPAKMDPPILVAYELTPVYQNFNRYLKEFELADHSVFNDTFTIAGVDIDEANVAWNTDVQLLEKLKSTHPHNEKLAVWSRQAAMPVAAKRYGWIHTTLNESQELMISVNSVFNAEAMKADKSIVLTTVPRVYVPGCDVVGGILILVGLVVLALEISKCLNQPAHTGPQQPLLE